MALSSLTLILAQHLFAVEHLREAEMPQHVFIAEDREYFSSIRHHQQKLVHQLASLRRHADELRKHHYRVHYRHLEDSTPIGNRFEDFFNEYLDAHPAVKRIHLFEVEDKPMAARIAGLIRSRGLTMVIVRSPMFLTTRSEFEDYLQSAGRPFMKTFYVRQRLQHRILIDTRGLPAGDRWSFDEENRKKLPKDIRPPEPRLFSPVHPQVQAVIELVQKEFPYHPGHAADFWLPTSRDEALQGLHTFLDERFESFGPYEDALSPRSTFVFHSLLTPALNTGLLTPREVMDAALEVAKHRKIPLNSLEGFVRQVIGWREFVRGIYQKYSDRQSSTNHWGHHRRLKQCWYDGTTGIAPLDDVIQKARKWGWTHHIDRLMVVGNLMLLSEIHPHEAHRWFMEMFVDSAEWVMGPNVYGMGIHSDGGIFATKPYICGSNYILKMSDYPKGPWCDVWDGLYWNFISRNQETLSKNPRMATSVMGWKRIKPERQSALIDAAKAFMTRTTESSSV